MIRHGEVYQDFLDEAYTQLYTQNADAQKALLDSGNEVLTHSIGKTTGTILTRDEFCSRLMAIRTELQTMDLVDYD